MTLPDIGNMADPLLLQVPHGRRVQKRNPWLHLRFAILFGNTITARNEYCVSYALRITLTLRLRVTCGLPGDTHERLN